MSTTRTSPADPVRWVVVLFAVNFAFQRISLPNISIPITLPFTLGWLALALHSGVVVLNQRRLKLWLIAAAVSALTAIPQVLLVKHPYVSVNSWAYWVCIWLAVGVNLRDHSRATFERCCRALASVGLVISALSLLFMGLQLVGLRYRDWVAELVPSRYLVQDLLTTYPVARGSELYKSNAWLANEPSYLSVTLATCLICGLIARVSVWRMALLLAGLISTTAGSGVAVLLVYVVAILVGGRGRELRRYLVPGVVLGTIFSFTVIGQSIANRVFEVRSSNSSTALRAVEPYAFLWPDWIADPVAVFIGHGAGSSRNVVENVNVVGLQVPSVAKMIFDYGLIGGLLLLAVMASTYFGAPDRQFALTLAVSMFTLQPASLSLVMCSLTVASLWAADRRGDRSQPADPLRQFDASTRDYSLDLVEAGPRHLDAADRGPSRQDAGGKGEELRATRGVAAELPLQRAHGRTEGVQESHGAGPPDVVVQHGVVGERGAT